MERLKQELILEEVRNGGDWWEISSCLVLLFSLPTVPQYPVPANIVPPQTAAPAPTQVAPPIAEATPLPPPTTSSPPAVANEPTQPKKAKVKAEKKKTGGGGGGNAAPVDVSRLDMRVGRILKAWKHPDADGLYVEEGTGCTGSRRRLT